MRCSIAAAIACVAIAGIVHADEGEDAVPAALSAPDPVPDPVPVPVRVPADADPFVRVSGTRFLLRGEPFHFLGANVAVMHGRPHRDATSRTLDAVRDDGLRVVRLWALGERAADAPEWSRDFAFRVGEEGWVETSFAHLDRAIAEAAERDLRVIVVLANRWRDYGGIPQYMRWAGLPFEDSPGASPTELELARFWDCARCDELYRAHVARVIQRTNAITGVPYRDDPTILAWELVNESSAPARAAPSLLRWTAEMARFVRRLDPNHLIAAGHIGYERASARATWLAVQRLAEIDYCDAHAYPTAYERVRDPRALARFVDDRVQLAHHVARKPFVWGEFGFATSSQRVLGLPRARWYDAFLRASHRDGVAGALVWTYVPYEDRPREHGIHPDGEGGRRTRDVRAVLARHARRWARVPPMERNPALGDAIGETPIFAGGRDVRGTSVIHDAWSTREPDAPGGSATLLRMPIDAFHRAHFEAVGAFAEGPIAQLWGEGRGFVRYRFRGPARSAPSRLVLRMRASSELPGRGLGAGPEDIARARITIDGELAGTIDLPVDDGIGLRVELVIEDPALLARLFAVRRDTHVLAIEIEPDVGAEGLCLYGEATGLELLDPAVAAELPGAIELTYE